MDLALAKQVIKTRWNIFSAQWVLLFGNSERKRIAESQLKSLKRARELENYRLKPITKCNLEKARQMFFEYSCSQYFMIHDGVYQEFKKFGIRYEQELEWRKEYILHWESQLSLENLQPVEKLENAMAIESISNLINLAKKGDGYAKLWYANALWKLCNTENELTDLQKQGKQMSIEIWQELSQQPISEISESHKKKIMPFLFAMSASTSEEYVRNYAKQQLEKNNF